MDDVNEDCNNGNEANIRHTDVPIHGLVPKVIPLGLKSQHVLTEPEIIAQFVGSSINTMRASHKHRVSIIQSITATATQGVSNRPVRPRCIVKPYVPPPDLVPPMSSSSSSSSAITAMRRLLRPFSSNAPSSSACSATGNLASSGVLSFGCVTGTRQDRLLPGQIPVSYPLDRLHNALVKILGERYLNLLDEFRTEHPNSLEIDDATMRRYLYLDFAGI
ncbi:hypothetical protein BIW11_12297 [Tropilaelaps mercedesae]|uniref:Uncharacterized protein n=1 Tax=Tropilaelaps mercedesae TaxID=418985 RepID=A0A1V9X7M7_9ACAR|nr:hypothetical protein BIW11_12297 [Tropilaelaps mercedesae]